MKNLWIIAFLFALTIQAQEKDHFNLELQHAEKTLDPQEEVNLYIRGNAAEIATHTRTNGGVVKGVINDIVSVRMPMSAIAGLRYAPFVDFIEFSLSKPQMLADVMITNNNIHPIHAGAEPLPQAYLGDDVIIGLIDSGIELDHPDFQNTDGSTRVIALWDQTQDEDDPFRVPQPYDYGQEWTAEDIDQDIDGHDDQPQFFGHGSTVSGVAVGNANATGDFVGVAPLADIIVVSSDFSVANWKPTVADAVDFIFAKAEALGKPVVINASLGDYYGSHDALDGSALFIESLLDEAPGRMMVSAAGNSNNFVPYHLSYDVPQSDTAFTWFSYNVFSAIGQPAVFFELWADSVDFYDTEYAIGADLTEPSYSFQGYSAWRNVPENINNTMIDTIFNGESILGIVTTWVGRRGDQFQMQVAVTEAFSDQYKWRFSTTGGGVFDVWSHGPFGTSVIESEDLPNVSEYEDMINYRFPDRLKTIVDSWTCSDKVVTVANYVNRDNYVNFLGEVTTLDFESLNISENSSSGPTRDNRQKPDITATGDVILSAGRIETLNQMISNDPTRVAEGGWHYRNGGTSMASPVVSGVAALYFERDPEATYADVKSAIEEYALADEFTGVLPNLRWGHGKLNGFAVLTEPFGVTNTSFQSGVNTLKIYPNPSSGLVMIEANADIERVEIVDLTGRLVVEEILNRNQGEVFNFSISLANGIYLVKAVGKEGEVNQSKLMIER